MDVNAFASVIFALKHCFRLRKNYQNAKLLIKSPEFVICRIEVSHPSTLLDFKKLFHIKTGVVFLIK